METDKLKGIDYIGRSNILDFNLYKRLRIKYWRESLSAAGKSSSNDQG